MKRFFFVMGLLSALLMLAALAAPGRSYAQATDPASVVRAQTDAFNAGDVDTAMAYFADNAVVTDEAGPGGQATVYRGQSAIRAFVLQGMASHPRTDIESIQVSGDTATVKVLVSNDDFRRVGLTSLEGTGTVVVQNGKIVSFTRGLTPESAAKLAAAFGAAPPGMPTTGSGNPSLIYAVLVVAFLALTVGLLVRWRPGAAR